MEKSLKLWYLEKFNMLQKLSRQDVIQLEQSMVMKKVGKDALIHFPEWEGKYIYLPKEGIIKIVHTSDRAIAQRCFVNIYQIIVGR